MALHFEIAKCTKNRPKQMETLLGMAVIVQLQEGFYT